MSDEKDLVAELQRLTAETTLEDCEKSDLWAYAKQAGLATPDEWPEITRKELVERIRAAYDVDEEAVAAVVYTGPLSSTVVRGFGRVVQGEPVLREDVTEKQWAALNAHPNCGRNRS